jgi:hypothetical protein
MSMSINYPSRSCSITTVPLRHIADMYCDSTISVGSRTYIILLLPRNLDLRRITKKFTHSEAATIMADPLGRTARRQLRYAEPNTQ